MINGMRAQGKSSRSKRRRNQQSLMVEEYAHETRCAWRNCTNQFGLGHAHRLKKRLILTEWEWVHGQVKLCAFHHHYAEYGDRTHKGTHRRMYRLITVLMHKMGRPQE